MSALQIWLQNHNRRLTQAAIDEALMEYITHIETELEAARKDAERYRWICSDDRSSHDVAWLTEGDIFYKGKCDIDSAIDAAIEHAKGGTS